MRAIAVYLWIIIAAAILIAVGTFGMNGTTPAELSIRWATFVLSVAQIALAGTGIAGLRSHGGASLTGTK